MEQKAGRTNKNLKMQYPLPERIGSPDLLTGRKKEFHDYHRWISEIPRMLSRSRVILARRKTGKTAFVQRIFNQLWSADSDVTLFYFEIKDQKIWLEIRGQPKIWTISWKPGGGLVVAGRERQETGINFNVDKYPNIY